MFGSIFSYQLLFTFFLFFHIESIFFFFLHRFWIITSSKTQRLLLKSNTLYLQNINVWQVFFLYLVFIIFFKVSYLSETFLKFFYLFFCIITLIYLLISYIFWILHVTNKNTNKYSIFIFQNLLFFTVFLYFCDSYMVLLFILELYSVIYYFFFLNTYKHSTTMQVIQYKNFILLYLWNSFFITLLYGCGILSLVFYTGTTSYTELNYFNLTDFYYSFFFIFFAFFLKLGMPGTHFFKVELYKYLDSINIFFFSMFTIFFNTILYLFFIAQEPTLLFLTSSKLFFIFLFFFMYIVLYYLKVDTFPTFLAFSSLITLVTSFSILMF